jgi:hypothetical protein
MEPEIKRILLLFFPRRKNIFLETVHLNLGGENNLFLSKLSFPGMERTKGENQSS